MPELWSLPGSQRFVTDAVAEIRSGRSLLIRCSRLADTNPVIQISRVLTESGYDSYDIDVAGEGAPAIKVCRALGLPRESGFSISKLFESEAFRRAPLLLADLKLYDCRDWFDFLNAFELRAKSVDAYDRPRFVLRVTCNVDEVPSSLSDGQVVSQRQWNGITSELDTAILITRKVMERELKPHQRRLLVAWVAQLALWDTELIDWLLALPLARLAMPKEALCEYGQLKGWANQRFTSWLEGTRNYYDGSDRRHSAWLALNDGGNELDRRLWAAQASVVLPLLDQHRRALIRESMGYLKPTLRGIASLDDALEMEFNELHNRLVQVIAPRSLQEKGRRLREHRNCLSHQRVIAFDQLFFSSLLEPPADDSHS